MYTLSVLISNRWHLQTLGLMSKESNYDWTPTDKNIISPNDYTLDPNKDDIV